MKWIKRIFGINEKTRDFSLNEVIETYEQKERQVKQAGSVDGKHYTEYVELVKQLKREERHDEAIKLLLQLVTGTEREARTAGWGVAPWYYEQLAIIYRKEKRYDEEVEILERYQKQTKASGAKPSKLAERLIKAKELRDKQKA